MEIHQKFGNNSLKSRKQIQSLFSLERGFKFHEKQYNHNHIEDIFL